MKLSSCSVVLLVVISFGYDFDHVVIPAGKVATYRQEAIEEVFYVINGNRKVTNGDHVNAITSEEAFYCSLGEMLPISNGLYKKLGSNNFEFY